MEQNKLQEARAMAEEASVRLAPLSDKFPEAYRELSINCENTLANILNLLKAYPEAVEHYKKAIDLSKALPPSRNRNYISGVLLGNYGAVQMYCKNYNAAESAYKESLSFFEHMTDANPESVRPNVAMQQFNLGALYRLFLQNFENAEKYLLLSIDNYQSLNDAHPRAYEKELVESLAGLALLYARNNMIEKANNYYYRACNILPNNNRYYSILHGQ
jgi:tetratricopeptide (TPR) repeat protein